MFKLLISKIRYKIIYWHTCYLNWKLCGEFRFPEPEADVIYFYNYCKQIVANDVRSSVPYYEEKISNFSKRFNLPREEIARNLINSYSQVYKELN